MDKTERLAAIKAAVQTADPPSFRAIGRATGLFAEQVRRIVAQHPDVFVVYPGPGGRRGDTVQLRKPAAKPKAPKAEKVDLLAPYVKAIVSAHTEYVEEVTGGPWQRNAAENTAVRSLADYLHKVQKAKDADVTPAVLVDYFYKGLRLTAQLDTFTAENSVNMRWVGNNAAKIIATYKAQRAKHEQQQQQPTTRVGKANAASAAAVDRILAERVGGTGSGQ
jgi:hypothetical protein